MDKTIITVVGKDSVGIIAKVCTYLSNNKVNIVQEYFNMMMIADISEAPKDFGVLAQELAQVGEEIGVVIKMQKEEIFNMMHRI